MSSSSVGQHRRSSLLGVNRRILLAAALVVGFTMQAAPGAFAAAPTARATATTTREALPVSFRLDALDPEGDPLTYAVVTQPTHGSVDDCATNLCTYTPAPGFVGVDSFTWKANDGTSDSNVASASITVTANVAPVARSQNVLARGDSPTGFSFDYVDPDNSYQVENFTVLTQPAHGALDGCSGGFCTYTPDPGFVGTDSFTWRLSDDLATSNTATVSLSVYANLAPEARDSSASVREGKQDFIPLDYGGQQSESLTFAIVTNPIHGTSDCASYYGQCLYEPFPGYTGPDSFTWKSSDGLLDSPIATVSITVRPNAVPLALDGSINVTSELVYGMDASDLDDDPMTTTVVTPPSHGTVTCNDTPTTPYCDYAPQAGYSGPDFFTWQVTDDLATSRVATQTIHVGTSSAPVAYNTTEIAYPGVPTTVFFSYTFSNGNPVATVLTQPQHGTLSNCSVPLNGCTYTANAGYTGPDAITWRFTDGTSTSNTATVVIAVHPLQKPVANDAQWPVRERTPASVSLDGYDPLFEPTTFTVLTQPTHGQLSNCANGSCTYNPTGSYTGIDSFTWRVSAGGRTSRVATLTLNVAPNNAPVALSQYQSLVEGTQTALGLSWADNDYYDTPTFTIVTQPTHGTLTNCVSTCFYTPAPNYRGPDSFTWKVNDGLADSNTATFSLFVTPNSAPVALNSSVSVREGRPSGIGLSWSSVAAGMPVTVTVVTPAQHGQVSCADTGGCTYTPTTGFTGADSFTWKLNDGFSDSNVATVSITVTPNHVPVAQDVSVSTPSNTAVTISLAATDGDGDDLTYAIVSQPTHGTLSNCQLVTFFFASCTYTPAAAFVGSDSFTFKASDDLSTSGVATASITVTGQPPVVNAGADASGTEGTSLTLTGTASDPDGQALTYLWSATAGAGTDPGAGCSFGSPTALTTTVTCNDNGSFTVRLTADDGGSSSSDTAILTIANANPGVSITSPTAGTQVDFGAPVSVTAPITDAGSNDTFGCNIDWGDATTTAGQVTLRTCTGTHTYATAGPKTITVTIADDDAGTATASVDITQHAQANLPPTAGAGPDQTGAEGSPVQVNGSGSDPESAPLTFAWSYAVVSGVDTGTSCSFGSPSAAASTFTCNDDGTFSVTLAVSDGVNTAVTDSATVTLSNTNPSVTITSPGAGSSVQVGTALSLQAAIADPGTHDGETCSIDWGDGTTVPGTMAGSTCSGTHTYAAVASRTITVTATDDDGGTGSATRDIAVTAAPNLPPTASAGADGAGTEGAAVQLTGSGSDPESAPLTFAWSYAAGPGVDAGATCSFGSPTSAGSSFACTDDGTYTVTLAVSDGVNAAVTDSATVTLSNANPAVSITAPAGGTAYVVGDQVSVSASLSDAGTNDTHTCSVNWGDAITTAGSVTAGTCTGSHAYATAGSKTITVTVTDDNSGTGTDSVGITVNAAPNLPPTASAGADQAGVEGSAVQLTGSGSDPESANLSYAWSYAAGAGVDAGASCSFGSPSAASSTFTCTDDGTYTVTLSVSDGVNAAATDEAVVTLANANPSVLITSPTAGTQFDAGATVSVSASTSDPGSNDAHTCSVDWGDSVVTAGTLTGGVCSGTHAYAAEGARTITVTAMDDDGGVGGDSVGITVNPAPVNEPPSANAGADQSGAEGVAVQFTGSGTDPENAPLTYSWTYAAGAGVDAGATCSFGSPSAASTSFTCTDDGTYTATLTVSDGVNPPVTDRADVALANVKPAVSVTAPSAGSHVGVGDPVTVTATTSDPGSNDSLTCSIDWGDSATTAGTLANGSCSGTHSYASSATRTITVTVADDDGGSASDSVVITVDVTPVDEPPTASAGSDQSGVEGAAVQLSGSGSDPEGAPMTYAWTYAAGAGVDGGASCSFGSPTAAGTTFSCTDDGTYTVTLSVSDASHTTTDSAVVTLANADPKVTITAPSPGADFATGATVSVTAGTSDQGANDARDCSLSWGDGTTTQGSLAGNGSCTGSHAYSASGARTITVTATDDDGGSGSDTVGITVTDTPVDQPPTADAGADQTGAEGAAVQLTGSGSDPEHQALTYHWTYAAGPGVDAGATCSFGSATAASSTITCTDDGTYTVTLAVSDGTHTATDSATVTLANANPTVTITAPAPGTAYTTGTTVNVSATTADPGSNDTRTCSAAWGDGTSGAGALAGGVCTASHSYSAAGDRTITVTTTDDDGASAAASVSISVTRPSTNKPPVVDAGADLTGMMGSTIQLRGRATDADRDRLTYRWSWSAQGVTCRFTAPVTQLNTKITCTPGGPVTVTLTVSDGVNTPVSDSLLLTVRTRVADSGDQATAPTTSTTPAGRRRRS